MYHATPKYKVSASLALSGDCGPEIQLQAYFFGPALGNGELVAFLAHFRVLIPAMAQARFSLGGVLVTSSAVCNSHNS